VVCGVHTCVSVCVFMDMQMHGEVNGSGEATKGFLG